jgi:hypothetical protein
MIFSCHKSGENFWGRQGAGGRTDTVHQSLEYINSGYAHIVDIDLKSFFDEVDHCILLQLVYRKVKLRDLDGWLRNRLRYCIWHDWKKPERKRKNGLKLGVEQGTAYAWSRTRKGGWAIAQSPILGTTITLKALKRCGYESALYYYLEITPAS